MSLPLVLSREQMQAVDRGAVERTGLPSLILMENAGRGVAESVLRRLGASAGARRFAVCVVCGAGNNGGDGFVVARHLALAGVDVRVLLAAPRSKMSGDAAAMLRALDAAPGVSVADLSSLGSGLAAKEDWQRALAGADAIVDAIFGTGLRAEVAGAPAIAIAAMNAARALTFAVDVPSGMDADSGKAHGYVVRADVTLTMGARKLGLVLEPSADAGEIEVIPLGVEILLAPALGPCCFWIEESAIRATLPRRAATAYKGDGGHLIVVAGSPGKTGAAWLASRAAMRAGAGLVTIASTAAGQRALDAKVIEAMTARFSAGSGSGADADADADAGSFDAIAALAAQPHVRALVVGPGIPVGPGMQRVVERLARELPVATVLDASALNLLGIGAAAALREAPAPRIVTPHPGEMARLIGATVGQVQADRLGTARAYAAESRAIVVLKGARTLAVCPDGRAFVNPTVEPALATAGSGDVLTGVLGALLSQAMDPLDAAVAAVLLHGQSGTWAARVHGVPGVIAADLPDAIAAVRASWSASDPSLPHPT